MLSGLLSHRTERKRSKGAPVPLLQPTTTQDPGKGQGGHKRHALDAPEPSTASAAHRRDREASTPVKHKKSTGKQRTEHAKVVYLSHTLTHVCQCFNVIQRKEAQCLCSVNWLYEINENQMLI